MLRSATLVNWNGSCFVLTATIIKRLEQLSNSRVQKWREYVTLITRKKNNKRMTNKLLFYREKLFQIESWLWTVPSFGLITKDENVDMSVRELNCIVVKKIMWFVIFFIYINRHVRVVHLTIIFWNKNHIIAKLARCFVGFSENW